MSSRFGKKSLGKTTKYSVTETNTVHKHRRRFNRTEEKSSDHVTPLVRPKTLSSFTHTHVMFQMHESFVYVWKTNYNVFLSNLRDFKSLQRNFFKIRMIGAALKYQ